MHEDSVLPCLDAAEISHKASLIISFCSAEASFFKINCHVIKMWQQWRAGGQSTRAGIMEIESKEEWTEIWGAKETN